MQRPHSQNQVRWLHSLISVCAGAVTVNKIYLIKTKRKLLLLLLLLNLLLLHEVCMVDWSTQQTCDMHAGINDNHAEEGHNFSGVR